jgi:hypothetical protein
VIGLAMSNPRAWMAHGVKCNRRRVRAARSRLARSSRLVGRANLDAMSVLESTTTKSQAEETAATTGPLEDRVRIVVTPGT